MSTGSLLLQAEERSDESAGRSERIGARSRRTSARRLAIGAPLAAGVFVLEMGSHIGIPFAEWLGDGVFRWAQFLLATPVVLWAAKPFFHRGWMSIRDAVAGADPDGVLDVAEQGEDHAKAEYRTALESDISAHLRQVVERQQREVIAVHDAVRSLRDRAS